MAMFSDARPVGPTVGVPEIPNVLEAEDEEVVREAEAQRGSDGTLEELMLVPNLTIADNSSEVFSVQFSPDGRFLAAACGDGAIRVFLSDTGALAHTLTPGTTAALPVTGLQFRPASDASRTRNVLVACNADGNLQHWHVTSGKCLHETRLAGHNAVLCLDFAPDASAFAVGCRDASVRIFDEATRAEVVALQGLPGFGATGSPGHSNRVFSVRYHRDQPDCLISGGWDNTVQIWDVRAGASVRSIYGPHIAGDALDVAGNTILSGSYRTSDALQLWDFGTGALVESVPWGQGAGQAASSKLYAAAFSRGSAPRLFAAGGSEANEAKVFDFRRGNSVVGAISGLPRGVFALDFSPSGDRVAVAGGDCAIRIVDMAPATGATRQVGTF